MDKQELLTTASLALLELKDAEVDRLGDEVSRMLDYFELMTKLDVDGLEPTTHAFQKENRLRTDNYRANNNPNSNNNTNNNFNNNLLIENGNDVEDNFFVIPNVL